MTAQFSPFIRAQESDACLTLTLNRPEKANALTREMLTALADHIEASDAQVLILTGAGSVFSAGADLRAVSEEDLALSPAWNRLSNAVAAFEGLSVAALNGTAAGGSLGMVMACDLRIAVRETQFFYPVLKMGVLPPSADPARMAALAGTAFAKRMLLTGARITAKEAHAAGFIDVLCAEDVMTEGVLEQAQRIAAPAAAATRGHLAAIKQMIG